MNRFGGPDVPRPPASLQYRRPVVRDLAWLVFDGALLPPAVGELRSVRLTGAEREELLGLLAAWDDGGQDDWLGPVDPRLRLGIYAERLIGAWLRHSRVIRLVATNWPLRDGKTTLGEADFLVERLSLPGDRLQLWELACKFYLGVGAVGGVGWVGPGLLDSLDAKLARIRGHQLPLIQRPGFREAWGSGWTSRAWVAGWLLEPPMSLPDPTHRASTAGGGRRRIGAVWAEAGTGAIGVVERRAKALGVSEWWVLPKRRWLRPVYLDEPAAERLNGLGDGAELCAAPGTGDPDCRMLAGIRWQACDQGRLAAEALRVMVVPRGWTQRARAASRPQGFTSSGDTFGASPIRASES